MKKFKILLKDGREALVASEIAPAFVEDYTTHEKLLTVGPGNMFLACQIVAIYEVVQ